MIARQRPRSPFVARILLIGGCVALVFVVTAIVREAQRRNVGASEIRAMETEIARLEQQRARMTDLLKEAEMPEFLESEARLRLGLQKPGETVLIVPEGSGGAIGLGAAAASPPPQPQSNVAKWWQRVFH